MGDVIEFVLGMARQVRFLRKILSQESIGVLVCAALPWAAGVGEKDLHPGGLGDAVARQTMWQG